MVAKGPFPPKPFYDSILDQLIYFTASLLLLNTLLQVQHNLASDFILQN